MSSVTHLFAIIGQMLINFHNSFTVAKRTYYSKTTDVIFFVTPLTLFHTTSMFLVSSFTIEPVLLLCCVSGSEKFNMAAIYRK